MGIVGKDRSFGEGGQDTLGKGGGEFRFGVGGRTFGKERGTVGERSAVTDVRGTEERGVVGDRSPIKERGVTGSRSGKEDRGVVGKEGRLAAGDNISVGGSLVKAGNGFNVGGAPSGVNGLALYIIINTNYFLILFTVKLCNFIKRLVLFFVRSHTLFLK